MKWAGVLAVAALSVACGGGASTGAGTSATAESQAAVAQALPPAPAPAREVTIPAGTKLTLDLSTGAGSATSKVEDPVRATLRSAVAVNGETVLPAGTEVVGAITGVERAGRVKGRAKLAYRFTTLRHDGERYSIRTASISHQGEATKGEDAAKIGIGAGAGAVIGGIVGGGDGAAKGAAIGGGAGTGVVLATRGRDVALAPGATVVTTLTAPLTLKVKG